MPHKEGYGTFLRWAGSKRQLLSELSAYWNTCKFTRYVEPFAGSASLFFFLNPKRALLGDLNFELIETMKQIKLNFAAVSKKLSQMESGEQAYYRIRMVSPGTMSSVDRASRFIYLNRFCFNGIYRTNLSGRFNVPYGGTKTGKIPSKSHLKHCSFALKRVRLVCGDFEETLRFAEPGDFVYMDPPYSLGSKRIFKEYGPSPFDGSDIDRIRLCMDRLDKIGASFVVSYVDSRDAIVLRSRYRVEKVHVRRNVGGFTDRRRTVAELLISNF